MSDTIKINNPIPYIILALCLLLPMVGDYGAFDYAAPHWLYVSIINIAVFIYVSINKKKYLSFKFNMPTKLFLLFQLGFFIVSFLSLTQSIVISESVINIARLFTFITSIFLLFIVFLKTKINFTYIAVIVSVFLIKETIDIVYYFFSNYSKLRTSELIRGIPHRYGNVNVLSMAIAIKFPFILYLFYKIKGVKKYVLLILILISIGSIFLIGARAGTLVVGFSLVVFSVFYFIENNYSIKKTFLPVGLLFIISLVSFYMATMPNSINENKQNSYKEVFFAQSEKNLYSTKTVSLSHASGRNFLWDSAINDFIEHPFLGVGLGNWRFSPKEDLLKSFNGDGFIFHTHVHNDFLQILAEIGIVGFLFYLGSFVLIIFFIFKLIKIKDGNLMIYITLFIAFFGYLIDAFLNFPHDRTPIQMLCAIVLSLVLAYYAKKFPFTEVTLVEENELTSLDEKTKPVIGNKFPLYLCVVFLIPALVVHYKEYKTSTIQYKLMAQIQNHNAFSNEYQISYDKANEMLDGFIYVNQSGMTDDDIKALFAISDNKYDVALKHLDTSALKTPNSYFSKSVKAKIYDRQKEVDSAFYYSKMIFDVIPAYNSNFLLLKNIYKYKNEQENVLKTFEKHLKARPSNRTNWTRYAEAIRKYKRDDELALKKIDSIIEFYPRDETLLNYKKKLTDIMAGTIKIVPSKPEFTPEELTNRSDFYDLGNKYLEEKSYKKAKIEYFNVLNIDKTNIAAKYKLGLVEVKLKDYRQAILYLNDVIETDLIKGGKPEYNRGFCYFKLKDFDNAKVDFTASYNKDYPMAKKLDPILLNIK